MVIMLRKTFKMLWQPYKVVLCNAGSGIPTSILQQKPYETTQKASLFITQRRRSICQAINSD